MSLILDEPCSASVISESDVTAYLFDQTLFDYLRFENDLFAEKLDEIVLERRADTANKKAMKRQHASKGKSSLQSRHRKPRPIPKIRTVQVPMTDERFAALVRHVRDVALFKNLTGRDMEMVNSRGNLLELSTRKPTHYPRTQGFSFYILNSGQVSVQIKQGIFGKKKEVASLKPGQLFGEISLILDQKCTADV